MNKLTDEVFDMTSGTADLQSQINKCKIHKQPFSIKNNSKDGLSLQVHHTVKDNNGDLICCRFVHAKFNENGEQLAVVDHTGSIFIIDFSTQKFWMLPINRNCYCIAYSVCRKNEIIVGRSNCSLDIVNTEDGSQVGNLTGHKLPPTQISLATGVPYCLTVSKEEAIIWDLRSDSPLHQLILHTKISVKQGLFMPVTNNILIRFQNGIIHIWKSDQFECIQQVIQKDWECKNIQSLTFTRNGRAMAVAGQSATISVFSVDTWSLMKIITLPDMCSGIKRIEFLPQLFDGGSNKILAVLTTGCTIHLIDTESHVHIKRIILPEGCISDFLCSNTGKYVACLLKTGEVNVYCAVQLLTEQPAVSVSYLTVHLDKGPGLNHRNRIKAKEQLNKVYQQINTALDLQHLKPFLQEYGEYPESFRPLIWKTLLHLPKNQDAYVSLVNKGLHMSVIPLDKTYPLQNKYLLSSIKRLLSCLAHWCPLLGEAKFLPVFVLPFLQIFKNDQFVCFEVILSIIVNWCQFWFEFSPLPPANVLIFVENLISEHDFELLKHFYKYNVTPVLYAWSILETAFNEVVRGRTWLQLWDHVLSNHPAFLLVVVAALNITCRTTLLKLTSTSDFEAFYHSDTVINGTTLVSKAYELWSRTQNEYHPKNYFKPYQPLVRGNIYQMFHGYPKSLFDKQLRKLNVIRDEEKSLQSDQQNIIKKIEEQEQLRLKEREVSEQQAKLKDLEDAYEAVMKQEEDRIAEQRQKLGVIQRSLRDQQKQMLHESCLRSKSYATMERLAELEKLIDNIDASHEPVNLKVPKEPSRHYTESIDHVDSQQTIERTSHNIQHDILSKKQEDLVHNLNRLFEAEKKALLDNKTELRFYITMAERLLQTIESELMGASSKQQCSVKLTSHQIKVLLVEIETLSQEIQLLLENRWENNGIEDSKKPTEAKKLFTYWNLFDRKIDNSIYSGTNCAFESMMIAEYNNELHWEDSALELSLSYTELPENCEKKIQRGMHFHDKSFRSAQSRKSNNKKLYNC